MSPQPVLMEQFALADLSHGAPSGSGDNTGRSRGAVFTKQSVVDFMLDLLGYVPEKPLHLLRLLEPSFGGGRFVLSAARRLVEAWRHSANARDDSVLDNALRAVELDDETFFSFRAELVGVLLEYGLPELSAHRLARAWLGKGDFLTCPIGGSFDVIVGNPPYVRPGLVPAQRLAQYRSAYSTMVGRADLYVPFFERSLSLLAPGGQLSFICADAWTKNEYGRELRKLITEKFALRIYVDMYGAPAFESEVGAYTSITVVSHDAPGPIRVARSASVDAHILGPLARQLVGALTPNENTEELPSMSPGCDPWVLRGDHAFDVIRDMESRFDTMEDAGCKIGIGVASGCDKVFIAPFAELSVEDSRKLPLAVSRDLNAGRLSWHGLGVVNPWADDGTLVDLSQYPKLARYLAPHRDVLSQRHTAKSDPARKWYKTIDRITPGLTWEPKLLIPDIRGDGNSIAYDSGTVYPQHNLYFITSSQWDLHALQAVLRSGIARLFVDAYAVRLGGGYLRFQAQYLRRIRIPKWGDIDPVTRQELIIAGIAGRKVSSHALERLYGIDASRLVAILT